MRFPTINGQRRQKVTIPQLNGGVNYRDAMNLLNDNQLTDVRNMWFKDGALRTRYGITVNKDYGVPQTMFEGEIKSHCFCRSSGTTFVVEEIDDGLYEFANVHAFDIDGCLVASTGDTRFGKGGLIVPFGQRYNGENYDAIIYFSLPDSQSDSQCEICGVRIEMGEVVLDTLSPYVPTVFVSGTGDKVTGTESAGGYMLEGYNFLTNEYIAYYNTDAESTKYYFPTASKGNTVIEYTQGSTRYTWSGAVGANAVRSEGIDITVNITSDYIEFSSPLPAVNGRSNNLKVTTRSQVAGQEAGIFPTLKSHAWFGGSGDGIGGGTRLFLAGDVYTPNRVYFSSLNNPLYFSENNYIDVGSTDSSITAFGKQSDMLVIFKDDETYFATYVAGESLKAEDVMSGIAVDIETLRATFPITQLSGNIGCDLPSTIRNMQNRLMWADSYGRVWTLIYSNEYSTRNIRAIGGLISRKLKDSNINLDSAIAVNYDNYYMLLAYDVEKQTNVAFVLDTEDYGYAYYTSYGSDKKAQNSMGWYAWELPQMNILFSDERAGSPLIFAKDGERLIAYTMADGDDEKLEADGTTTTTPISCMFQTKLFDMKYPEKQKSFDRIYLSIGESRELCAQAVYVTEKGNFTDSAKIASDGISDAFTAQFIGGVTLSPNIRSKRFALRLENEGRMYVDGISIYYKV